ncbi:hypothetical protein [uncultured Acetatifactor sp.]|uniref:hypothetical protein n=1 Tax=uncultured Acetatifactor sp. TaxID=1671927 RepID=UPI00262FEE4D|nr:hypothetical protein [uncultured Acetatifactor sp.]
MNEKINQEVLCNSAYAGNGGKSGCMRQRKAFLCDDPAADQHGEWRIYADSCA